MKMNTIGERIRALRLDARQSQSELARLIGVSRSQVSMIECGNREIRPSELEQIADIYNVDMNFLYGKQSEQNSHRIVSDFEYDIIKAYRKASPEVRAIIDGIAKRQ